MEESERANKSLSIRVLFGILWFIVIYIALFYSLVEFSWYYAHSVATGDEALKIDKALSRKLGSTVGLWGFVIIALIVARLSVKGVLPGTGKFKRI